MQKHCLQSERTLGDLVEEQCAYRLLDDLGVEGSPPVADGALGPLRDAGDRQETAVHEGRSLATLDEAELRYVLTFLSESTTTAVRQARVAAIVSALPIAARSSR